MISEEMERSLVQWIFSKRKQSLRVCRKMVRRQAMEVFGECEDNKRRVFKASRGWFDNFLDRNELKSQTSNYSGTKGARQNDREDGIISSFHGKKSEENQGNTI